MTERISNSLAVSALTHAAVIVIAGLLLSRVSKIEILPTPTNTFVLVSPDATWPPSPAKPSNTPATVSLPPIPKPVISQAQPERLPEIIAQPSPAVAPLLPGQPRTTTVTSRPQMSFKEFQAAHANKPATTTNVVTHIVAPSIAEPNMRAPLSTSWARPNVEADAERNAFTTELIQKLREAYVPAGVESSEFSCRIEFVLSADGRIASSRILKSSGNRVFDSAVSDALARLHVSTPPKALVGAPLTTTFQVEP